MTDFKHPVLADTVCTVKLYSSVTAPNPRRVHVYLAEKGLEIPTQLIDLGNKEQFTPQFEALSPDHVVPILALDDGTVIGESLAICRYLEALYPDPPMFGRDAREQGRVEMWLRQIEIQGYFPTQDAYRNSRPGFAGRALPGTRGEVPQIPELVPRSNATMARLLDKLDRQIGERDFVVGDAISMADVVLLTTLDFGQRTNFEVVTDLSGWPRVDAWLSRMRSRPSGLDH